MKHVKPFKIIAASWIFTILGSFTFSMPAAAVQCETTSQNVTYVRRLAEVNSWAEPIRGIGEISRAEAKGMAHFRIHTNACGYPVDIRYFHGDVAKPMDENFAGNRFILTSGVAIERSKQKAVYRFFDHSGEQMTVFGKVQRVEVFFDDYRRPREARFIDAAGVPVETTMGYANILWTWSSFEHGHETRYDSNGKHVVSGSEFQFSSAKLTRDKFGFVKTFFTPEDALTISIERDANGARQSWSIAKNGVPHIGGAAGVAKIEFSYDRNAYLNRARYLGVDGNPMLARSGHMGFQRQYTSAGNRLGYDFIDSAGQVWLPPARGYAGQRFQWRDDGLVRIRTDYVDETGHEMNHPDRGYATIIHAFDSQNKETQRDYRDQTNIPVNID